MNACLMTAQDDHSPRCECRGCLGVDYDRYHHMVARDEYAERTDYSELD
jgi:hypothetical protein